MKSLSNSILLLIAVTFAACGKNVTLEQLPSQYTTWEGNKIHYKAHGERSRALVFVHGFGCDMNAWQEQFPYFAEKNIPMVFVDLPGFGKSDKPHADYTFDFFAGAVKTVIDAVGVSQPILVGHSLGSPICRQVARNYPGLDAMLCKVDEAACRFPEDSLEKAEYKAMFDGMNSGFDQDDITGVMNTFVDALFAPSTPEWVKEYVRSSMVPTPAYIASSTMRNMVDEKWWNETPMTLPTMVVVAKDFILWPDNEEYQRNMYPNLTYHTISNTGHFIMMEHPEEFNGMLWDFVK